MDDVGNMLETHSFTNSNWAHCVERGLWGQDVKSPQCGSPKTNWFKVRNLCTVSACRLLVSWVHLVRLSLSCCSDAFCLLATIEHKRMSKKGLQETFWIVWKRWVSLHSSPAPEDYHSAALLSAQHWQVSLGAIGQKENRCCLAFLRDSSAVHGSCSTLPGLAAEWSDPWCTVSARRLLVTCVHSVQLSLSCCCDAFCLLATIGA